MKQEHEMRGRVDHLRRRWMMLAWMVAAVLAGATVGVWSQTPSSQTAPPQRLTAEEIVLVDPTTGKTRALLAFEPGVGPSLQLFDGGGGLLLRVGVTPNGPSVASNLARSRTS